MTSRLRSPISPSMQTTFDPLEASATARFATAVVLPTPPFPDVMVTTCAGMYFSCKQIIQATFFQPVVVLFDFCVQLQVLDSPEVSIQQKLHRRYAIGWVKDQAHRSSLCDCLLTRHGSCHAPCP